MGGAIRANVELRKEWIKILLKIFNILRLSPRHGADQRYEEIQLGDGRCQWEGDEDERDPEDVLGPHLLLRPHPPRHYRVEEIDGHIELEREGEEDGEGHHDLDENCQARAGILSSRSMSYNLTIGQQVDLRWCSQRPGHHTSNILQHKYRSELHNHPQSNSFTKESHRNVQTGDENHGSVQDAIPAWKWVK